MAISKEFENAVSANDIMLVRIMLKDIMIIDTTLNQFDKMLSYAEERISNLYDEHDREELFYSQEKWDKTYLNNQMVAVVNNFSKERIELLMKLIKHIYPTNINSNPSSMSVTGSGSGSDYRCESKTSWSTQKKIGIGMVATGAIATVAGVCASEGLLIAGGIGVAVIGAGFIITDKG